MVPIVYKMSKEGKNNLIVLSISPVYKIKDDFRLNFLREKCNIKVDYLYHFFCPTIMHKFLCALICKPLIRAILYKLHLFNWIYENLVKQVFFNEKWAIEMLKDCEASAMIFDSAMHNDLYNYKALRSASKKLNIPIIFVPHGMRFSPLTPAHEKKIYTTTKEAAPDFLIVPHREQLKEAARIFNNLEKVSVIGITRYCAEWMEVVGKILPAQKLPRITKGKLKVVYLSRHSGVHGNATGVVEETLNNISNLDFVHLIVKPHTRSNGFEFKDLIGKVSIATDIHTTNLFKWADVVIGTLSSVMIEALISNKVLILPKYFGADDRRFGSVYFEDTACWKVNDYDELESALKTLRNEPDYRPYSQENVEEVITEYVYNGEKNNDVLGRYAKFISGIKKSSQETINK